MMEIHTQVVFPLQDSFISFWDLLNFRWCQHRIQTHTLYEMLCLTIILSLIPCTQLMEKEFRFLIYQLVNEMKGEIKHAEMLTITIIKVFNSDKRPFALFETKTLIIFHLQEEREISALLTEIVAMRGWKKQQKCLCSRRQGKFCSNRTMNCSTAPHLGVSIPAQSCSSPWHTGSSAPQPTPGAPVQPQSSWMARRIPGGRVWPQEARADKIHCPEAYMVTSLLFFMAAEILLGSKRQ